MKLFDTTLGKLQSSLNVRLERQNVLAGNLANLDTPGYLPRELDFEKAMAAAQAPSSSSTAQTSEPTREGFIPVEAAGGAESSAQRFITVAEGAKGGLDGNGVDLDKTMVELSRNGLMYGAAAKTVGKKLAILRYVAGDGIG
jgi:flagellar basal-body rod protein FlgB